MKNWVFITNHGAILLMIAEKQKISAVEIAGNLKISERSVWRIIADLGRDGYIIKTRVKGVNSYQINQNLTLRRPAMRDIIVEEFIEVFHKKGNDIKSGTR